MASRLALALLAASLLVASAAAAQFAPRPTPGSLPSASPGLSRATTFREELKQVASILASQKGYSLPAQVFSTLSNFPRDKLALVENTTVFVPTDSALKKIGLRALFNPGLVTKFARYNIIHGRFSFEQLTNLSKGSQLRSLYKNRPVERKAVSPAAKDWVVKNKDLLETNFFEKLGNKASGAINKLLPPAGNEVGFGRPNSGPLSWVRVTKPDLFNGNFIKVHGVDSLLRPAA
ncbi:hypothetical protein CLOM_g13690 [Closterium sp. NIES-68]|nr:hypothetical protein CLOM_g3486 [Closterium sp. NIES-68]GJP54622.1 hypothetical protein CLOM_g13690 [Closterium sp. NIES-68]GJP73474.1 hypothetical protein CLOP_g4184 [Closterium sp. NIES-67]GJP82690.1 hypothetical protein CLOP_g12942 [Closterium sp. NIES-67]